MCCLALTTTTTRKHGIGFIVHLSLAVILTAKLLNKDGYLTFKWPKFAA